MRETILKHLGENHPWASSVQYFKTITSTNDVLKVMAREGAQEGTVLIADSQTGGRGRLGRSFLSPPDTGVYLSLLLRPNCSPAELMHLTCAAAEAMCEAVEQSAGFRPGIKWTNDLVYDKHKLAGILTELGFSPDGLVDYAVIGIGINCRQKPEDFAPEIRDFAGSLEMFSGFPIDRAKVAAEMVRALYTMHQVLLTDRESILSSYRRDCITLGKRVQVIRADSIRLGTALDIDQDGGLIVAFDDGPAEAVSFGEVSVRGMYGYL